MYTSPFSCKATWHPFYEDLCVIGRYAENVDLDKTRCVDVIDLQKGFVVAQFYDPLFSQIMVVSLILSYDYNMT